MPTETDRICTLPLWTPPAPGQPSLQAIQGRLARGPEAPPLRQVQLQALHYLERAVQAGPGPWGPRGLAGLIGCGHGKTLIGLLAGSVTRARRPLYLLPASLVSQLQRDVAEWRAWYLFPSPEVCTYERLSAPTGRDLLTRARPDLLVLDEAHYCANPKSGRWRRISRYIRQNPGTRVVVMSGTMTWRSIGQIRHLLVAALRDWAPVPADNTAELWGEVLDVASEPSRDAHRVVAPLVRWASRVDPPPDGLSPRRRARLAFQARLGTAPATLVTSGVSADVSLRLRRWAPDVSRSAAHREALVRLDLLWELPDGTQLTEALEHHRHASTLALGYYTRWADDVDPDWLASRQGWGRAVRRAVEYLGYDTPGLVAEAAKARTLDRYTLAAWDAWQAWADTPAPETETVWVDEDYSVRVAAAYLDQAAPKLRDSVIWVESPRLGTHLASCLGLQYYGQGSGYPPGGGPAVVSRPVFGKGWDGQAFSHNLYLQPSTSAAVWEQGLARTHRPGQVEDVDAWILTADACQRVALEVALAGSRYVQDTTGEPQRLIYGDWLL